MIRSLRPLLASLAVVAALALTVASADARSSGSSGSRGSRTFSAPPPTRPRRRAAPIERSMTQPAAPALPCGQAAGAGAAAKPGCSAAACSAADCSAVLPRASSAPACSECCSVTASRAGWAASPRCSACCCRSGSSLVVARLVWAWWQRRKQPAMAARPVAPRQPVGWPAGCRRLCRVRRRIGRELRPTTPIEVKPEDFDTFEKLLGDIQTAYGKRGPRRAARRIHARDAVVLLRRAGAEREQRRRQPDFRRQAAAGRSRPKPGARATTNTPPSRCAIR